MVKVSNTSKAQNKNDINDRYEEIRSIYDEYRTIIRPFVAFLELFDREFPVEILNEVRAVMQHIARCYYSNFEENNTAEAAATCESCIDKNISKAKSHINRALLDCFKYSCVSLFDEYKEFRVTYKYVDLSTLDNGEFLKNLHILKEEAKIADKEARTLESDSGDEDAVFERYEEAFNKSVALHEYIIEHSKFAANLKRKAPIGKILAGIGWAVGLVSGLQQLWSAFGDEIMTFFGGLLKSF